MINMQTFEYKKTMRLSTDELNTLGRQGWELVSVASGEQDERVGRTALYHFFKRPIADKLAVIPEIEVPRSGVVPPRPASLDAKEAESITVIGLNGKEYRTFKTAEQWHKDDAEAADILRRSEAYTEMNNVLKTRPLTSEEQVYFLNELNPRA